MKLIISRLQQLCREGEYLPPWYYGYAYKEWDRQVTVFYPIPINFVIRFLKHSKFLWDNFRGKPSYIDKKISEMESIWYNDGRESAIKSMDIIFNMLIEQKIKEIKENDETSLRNNQTHTGNR